MTMNPGAKWVQVDCRPTYACFRNHSFFYNDTKIYIADWPLNLGMKIYKTIIVHDDREGWATINLDVIAT